MLLLLAFFQRSTPWGQFPTGTTVNKVCKTTCVGRRTILLMKSLTAISGGYKETKTVSSAHHYTHAALRIIARAVYKACKPYHHKSTYFPMPKNNNPKHSIKHDSILFIPQGAVPFIISSWKFHQVLGVIHRKTIPQLQQLTNNIPCTFP